MGVEELPDCWWCILGQLPCIPIQDPSWQWSGTRSCGWAPGWRLCRSGRLARTLWWSWSRCLSPYRWPCTLGFCRLARPERPRWPWLWRRRRLGRRRWMGAPARPREFGIGWGEGSENRRQRGCRLKPGRKLRGYFTVELVNGLTTVM